MENSVCVCVMQCESAAVLRGRMQKMQKQTHLTEDTGSESIHHLNFGGCDADTRENHDMTPSIATQTTDNHTDEINVSLSTDQIYLSQVAFTHEANTPTSCVFL